ncbi:MAG: acyl carrier protein [Aquabacterium sp.]
MSTNTREALRRYVLENCLFTDDGSKLQDGASFLETGVLDSTGILEIILFVEETFGVKVTDDEMVPDNLDSIDALVAFVDRKRSAQEASQGSAA